ncbi:hypothetical protein BDN67DRAFT_964598 [Paxillus ammoniavirescens]|nr:hypothetical protein BDN67DRAFT_964598 [Paxillus ammoniavirescens]
MLKRCRESSAITKWSHGKQVTEQEPEGQQIISFYKPMGTLFSAQMDRKDRNGVGPRSAV